MKIIYKLKFISNKLLEEKDTDWHSDIGESTVYLEINASFG